MPLQGDDWYWARAAFRARRLRLALICLLVGTFAGLGLALWSER
jgi:hypothetical protein